MSTSPQVKQLIGVLFGLPSVYRQAKKSQSQTGSSSTADAQQSQNEMMMPCARCGLHVLESEGIKLRGQFYCTKAHS